jgi:hypothetical protein
MSADSSGMSGSATGPLRASDAERDAAVDRLRDEFVEGRLSQDTFLSRMHGALSAQRRGELRSLLADLPESDSGPGLARRVRELTGRLTESLRSATGAARGALTVQRPRRVWRPPVRVLCFPPAGEQLVFIIGRDIRCDLPLADPTVSREHAQLIREPDGWRLADLNSMNGTWVNDWRIREPAEVRAGDRIRLGSMDFILRQSPDLSAWGLSSE